MSLINGIFCGLCGLTDEGNQSCNQNSEKAPSDEELAAQIVDKIYTAEKSGNALKIELRRMVQANGLREYLAQAVINALATALKEGRAMSAPLKEAYDEACEEARKVKEWTDDNPVIANIIYTIIALGIVALLMPWLLGVVGFVDGDIVAGSWVARWMSRYQGFVPKGSLLSYIQSLVSKLQR